MLATSLKLEPVEHSRRTTTPRTRTSARSSAGFSKLFFPRTHVGKAYAVLAGATQISAGRDVTLDGLAAVMDAERGGGFRV